MAFYLGVERWRKRGPSRHGVNVHTSILLMLYLLGTAGLGIFWVANQQLPVFDLHYLFGYATIALVIVHLVFNLPIVVRYFKPRKNEGQARIQDRAGRNPGPGFWGARASSPPSCLDPAMVAASSRCTGAPVPSLSGRRWMR